MADSIALNVAGQEIKNFLAYEVDADMYEAAAAFHVALANPEIAVKAGQNCKLYVNGQLALNGYVDKLARSTTKGGLSLRLEGRDMMGLLVDWYLTEFKDSDEKSIKNFAEGLLKLVPVIELKDIKYDEGVFPEQKGLDRPRCVELGQTILTALRRFAAKHGLLFYCMPDGRFRFSAAKVAGEAKFNIVLRKDGRGNNALRADVIEDLSKRYASVTIASQAFRGSDNLVHDAATKIFPDDSFPKHAVKKPFVIAEDMDAALMPVRANQIFADMRHQSFHAVYVMKGHSQNYAQETRLWTINEICSVDDEVNNLHGNYLVTGRTFCLSRERGRTTKVRIGLPGMKVA